MIIRVSTYNGLAAGHQYNQKRAKLGELIDSNMLESDPDGIKREFQELHDLNPRAVENYQFVISMATGEDYEKEKWNAYVHEVLANFGLEDHKFYAIKHNDTDNPHVHLVVSGVDLEGKPSPKMRGFYKKDAAKLAMDISLRDGHEKPVSNTKTTSPGVSQSKFGVYKELKKALLGNDKLAKEVQKLNIPLHKQLSNKEIKPLINNNSIYHALKKRAELSNYKTLVSKKVKDLQKEFGEIKCNGVGEWIHFCESKGLYCREIKKDRSIVYGFLINNSIRYFNEKQLNLHFDKSSVASKSKRVYQADRVIKRIFNYSKSLSQLNAQLKRNNLLLELRINASGLYGGQIWDLKSSQIKTLSSCGIQIDQVKALLNNQELQRVHKLAKQKRSLTIPSEKLIFESSNSKLNYEKPPSQNIHQAINTRTGKVLDREQYEHHDKDFYDRNQKTI